MGRPGRTKNHEPGRVRRDQIWRSGKGVVVQKCELGEREVTRCALRSHSQMEEGALGRDWTVEAQPNRGSSFSRRALGGEHGAEKGSALARKTV